MEKGAGAHPVGVSATEKEERSGDRAAYEARRLAKEPEQVEHAELDDERRDEEPDELQEPDDEDDDQLISRSFSLRSGYRPRRQRSFRNSFRVRPVKSLAVAVPDDDDSIPSSFRASSSSEDTSIESKASLSSVDGARCVPRDMMSRSCWPEDQQRTARLREELPLQQLPRHAQTGTQLFSMSLLACSWPETQSDLLAGALLMAPGWRPVAQ